MVHQDDEGPETSPAIKQVEFNTIASSFGGLSIQTSNLHKYVLVSESYIKKPLNAKPLKILVHQ